MIKMPTPELIDCTSQSYNFMHFYVLDFCFDDNILRRYIYSNKRDFQSVVSHFSALFPEDPFLPGAFYFNYCEKDFFDRDYLDEFRRFER